VEKLMAGVKSAYFSLLTGEISNFMKSIEIKEEVAV
jgi:hypothetical protein